MTISDLVERLGVPRGRVRRLLEDSYLVGSTRQGALAVPDVFLFEGHPLPSLRGTVIVLRDAGFSDDEVIDWLLADDDTLGRAPIDALRAGSKGEVRRLAKALG